MGKGQSHGTLQVGGDKDFDSKANTESLEAQACHHILESTCWSTGHGKSMTSRPGGLEVIAVTGCNHDRFSAALPFYAGTPLWWSRWYLKVLRLNIN